MLKKVGIGLLVALVVATMSVGVVMAQGDTPPDPPNDGALPPMDERMGRGGPGGRSGLGDGVQREALAEALGMTTEELQAALQEGQTVAELAEANGVDLDELVDTLITPVVEKMKQRMYTQFQNGKPEPQTPLADALGMTPEALHEALAEGQTVAELAEANGVALDDLVDALMAPNEERLQQAVEDGRLTQEEADEKLAEMEAQLLEQIESGECGAGPGMRGGPEGPRGMGEGRPGGMRGERGLNNGPGALGEDAPKA